MGIQNIKKEPSVAGYRVLDLTDEKGMLCAKLLADLGADVIKIEKPGGDPSRSIAPFLNDIHHPDRSLYFWHYNTNKRSITLNLETLQGQELFKRLVVNADVLVESYPPGYLEERGLGYNALNQINTGLVVASITAFGQSGPYRDYKTSDMVASASGGQTYVCGDRTTPPLQPFGEQVYQSASLFAAIGILLALRSRHSSSRGQHIDISLQECVAATADHVLVRYFNQNTIAQRQGNLHWSQAFRILPCRDGHILISLFQQWETLVEWLDSEGMAADLKDKRWQDPPTRLRELDHITRVLEQWTRTHTVNELFELGQLMHFPWAEVASVPRVMDNPQLKARDFFVNVAHPELEKVYQYPGAPYRFSHSRWQLLQRSPSIGEHNTEVYSHELGLSAEELAGLAAGGVI